MTERHFCMRRWESGFTLVEVIVVAVIVSVLAAVAIPIYGSYIESARCRVVDHEAASLAKFLVAARNMVATLDPPGGVLMAGMKIMAKEPYANPPNNVTTFILGDRLKATVKSSGGSLAADGGSVTVEHLDHANNYSKTFDW